MIICHKIPHIMRRVFRIIVRFYHAETVKSFLIHAPIATIVTGYDEKGREFGSAAEVVVPPMVGTMKFVGFDHDEALLKILDY